jgi:uncharacterized protein (TIGR02996 family)
MSPDNPFLRSLLAQPDDDTLRLAMADWLDENDQPARAEFIRVQVELARGVEERDRRIALEKRQAELLIAHEREWVKPLLEAIDGKENETGGWSFLRGKYEARHTGNWWGCCVFRRGFAEYFHLPAPVVNRHGEKLARLTPVRELYLDPCVPVNVVWLCKKPWLKSVAALYVSAARLNANAVKALIACPHFENMRKLDIVAGEDVSEETAKDYYKRFGRHLVRSPHA